MFNGAVSLVSHGSRKMRGLWIFIFLAFAQVLNANSAAIHEAAKKGDLAALTAALNAGTDVNEIGGGATPLYFAAIRGHLEAAKLLIAQGADVNAKTKFGSPLMAAAAKGGPELVNLLLANGADPNAEPESQTALHVAAEYGCLGCVKALVDAGADVNAQHKNTGGQYTRVTTPLHLAILYEHHDVADYLITHGVILPKPAPIAAKLASADPGKGREFFNRECRSCHSIFSEQDMNPGPNKGWGPNLWSMVGRDKASLDYEGYSKTLRALDGVWTYEDLNTFLSGPAVTTPGVNMQFQGAPNEVDRVNVIAYLRTLSNNPVPLP
jgi:cytochrome c